MSTTTVVGLFETPQAAQDAAQALVQAGFPQSDIDIAASDTTGTVTGATTGQKAESSWEKMLVKLHLAAPEDEAGYYSQGLRTGQTLVSVATLDDSRADNAADILDQYGAINIEDELTDYRSTAAALPATAPTTATATDGTVIPIVEEQLAVGKRTVQRGGVRVYQTMTERPVEEQVTLRDEHVTVTRRPVDRAATSADGAFREDTLEITTTGEEAVVAKNARVVEEVVVGKTATDRTETVRDTVRRTDVQVDEMDQDDDLDRNLDTTGTTTTRR